ncbi:MAG: 1-deoxy-D-xylulose-5-phosphate synthase [Bacteroidetes bacterium]|nr:1-deoxy-D-xylulose-5-phosphate synthase [Bacteroidota bacterium]MBT4338748.1 1-deoxy-D-xylulose-5-phosphate synthase [Bacteroidota bacterium]MBT4729943.1 1-deoxy-D-xylulose-5-phosphate synthase [Bacteroidota bacterium]
MSQSGNNILNQINSPDDLKKLSQKELSILADELRQFIIETVTTTGGHLAASLGVVELTIALHYIFNTPDDSLIWDVGHQAYGHKILTGRRDQFLTNRKKDGISGFPKMSESEYDSFGTGHASTSISAILGMAEASQLEGCVERNHIAVIGDGALTGGMAFEALNNAGVSDANLLVVLNDNRISIDAGVGALKEYLMRATASPSFNRIRIRLWQFLGRISKLGPDAQATAAKLEHRIKTHLFKESNLFESLRFRYFGPIDGHDIPKLTKILSDLKKIEGPKLLHVMTVKGKGYEPAEKYQTKYHSVSAHEPKIPGLENVVQKQSTKYQDVFGITLVELAKENEKIIGITPAMPTGSSLHYLMDAFPDRAFDVGIAEQHAVTFAAGMATKGFKPYCVIYSTFLQRAYDQLIHDVCLQNLPVVFCIDRAGLVGEDGATHQGAFDIAFLKAIPNIAIASPLNEVELRHLLYSAQFYNSPIAIRYPRGGGVLDHWQEEFKMMEIGKGQVISEGEKLLVLTFGPIGNHVIEASKSLNKEGIVFTHADMRFAKPLDEQLLLKLCSKHQKIICVEEGITSGGFGSAILEFIEDHELHISVKRLGFSDEFIEHASVEEQQEMCGLSPEKITETIRLVYNSLS